MLNVIMTNECCSKPTPQIRFGSCSRAATGLKLFIFYFWTQISWLVIGQHLIQLQTANVQVKLDEVHHDGYGPYVKQATTKWQMSFKQAWGNKPRVAHHVPKPCHTLSSMHVHMQQHSCAHAYTPAPSIWV